MKKEAIRKGVERAKNANMKQAIADVGRSKAFSEVYDAMTEGSPAEEAAESPAEEAAEMASETITQAGYGSTPAAAMANAMKGRK